MNVSLENRTGGTNINSAAIEQSEETPVFEQPFELNETQVMFKAESAEFVDSAAAEAALKPVADVILAHPDHPILLAGTTATDGDQAARVGFWCRNLRGSIMD